MKKILLGTTAIIILVAARPSGAAELSSPLPTKAPIAAQTAYNWTGCYVGAQGGGGVLNDLFSDINGGGGIAGGQLGCNYQTGRIVFGLEGETAWSGLRNGFNVARPTGSLSSDEFTDRNRWSADIAARVGVTVDRALIYGKVGVAAGQFELSEIQTHRTPPSGFQNAGGTLNGLLLGAGIEYAFAPNWSARLEYDRIDYLGKTLHFNADGVVLLPGDFSASAQTNIVKAGINYRFGGADFAPVADLPARSAIYKAPVAAAYSWTGCYAGVQGSGGALNDSFVIINGGGGLAGGQLGCNIQTGAIVFGLEGEAAWSGLRNSFDFTQPGGSISSLEVTDRNRWSADVAARAGVAVDRALIYGKVGVATGRFAFSQNEIAGGQFFDNASGTLNGLLLGAGVEYALAPNWSAKLEYDHIDYLGKTLHFNTGGVSFGNVLTPFDESSSAQANIVKAGINYRFGGSDLPLADRSRPILPAAAYSWTGCYAGVHGGGGVLSDLFFSINGGGGIAGGQLGCNIQTGQIVFGLEGEAAWSALRNSFNFTQPGASRGSISSLETTDLNRWSADVAARAGVAVDRVLIYGKVGVDTGQFEFSEIQTLTTLPNGFQNGSGTLSGLLLGAGIEYAFAPSWSAKLEYDHVDYLGKTLHFNADGFVFLPSDESVSAQTNIVKAGVNYRFGGPNTVVAKY